ncbi:hypothetical protein ACF3M1_15705 [Luteimonas sp. WGS1318]|uniref:hypothetical protein n=1 Tax=Luteimonas sp. WGS1318 TaxID=3366815 RepID=UPI00372CFE3C
MTVQRSSEPTVRPPDQSARNRQVDRQSKGDGPQAPARETVDQFRSLMQQTRGDAGTAQSAMTGEGSGVDGTVDEGMLADQAGQQEALKSRQSVAEVVDARTFRQQHEPGMAASHMPSAESAAMLQAQMALRDGAQTPAPAAPPGDPGQLMEMMERHVRQLAVHDASQSGSDGQVLLRMHNATLPGTDLLLSREGDGWVLRADSRSRESFDAIREAGPQLAQRFAERNLGTLTIDPHFHG